MEEADTSLGSIEGERLIAVHTKGTHELLLRFETKLLLIATAFETDEIRWTLVSETPSEFEQAASPLWDSYIGLTLTIVYRLVNVRNYVDGLQFIFEHASHNATGLQIEVFGCLQSSKLDFRPTRSAHSPLLD
jgi:hypothetical protein